MLYKSTLSKNKRKRFFSRHSISSRRFRRSLSSRQSSLTSQDLSIQSQSVLTLDARKLQAAFEKPQNSSNKKDEFYELEQKLRPLTVASGEVKTTNVEDLGIQTSLTDLSGLGKRPEMQDAEVQCCMIPSIDTTTTTTTSENEEKALLKYPIEAHVTQIRVNHEVSDSSSIPSSFDKDFVSSGNKNMLKNIFTETEAQLQSLNNAGFHSVPHHNRGRRGGIVDLHTAAQDLDTVTMDELELKAKTPVIADNNLAISTPSS